jgi:2'-5' RNA ligase
LSTIPASGGLSFGALFGFKGVLYGPAAMDTSESALVVLVPQAEALVGPFRDRYDPSAAAGVPAHITLLYPFKSPDDINATLGQTLRECFGSFAAFQYSLLAPRRFPGVLYLAPDLDEPFRQLTSAVWKRSPETPPYGGKWPNIVPHLTVAQVADPAQLDRIASDFSHACHGRLPIRATAKDVTLMEKRSERWAVRETFAFGAG